MTEQRDISVGYGAIAVALAAIVVYAGTLANGFAFDDVVLIPRDPRVIHAQIGALLTRTYWGDAALGLYRPLTSVSFALDWFVSKGSPAWFHFTNVLWHVLASVFAYALLSRFFRPAAALAGGLVFALHPVHVEAVANVVGRSELIAATFFFAACLVWSTPALSSITRTALAAICYAIAMFAKESAVVLPAVLLLIDFATGRTNTDIRKRWGDYAILAATLLVFLVIRWSVVSALGPSRLDPSLELTRTYGERVVTAFQAWPVYLELFLFPRTLLADYGPRILLPLPEWTPAAAVGLTIASAMLIGGIVALVRGQRLWALGLLWFPITILPVSNLIVPIGVLVAERTLYLPLFALSFAVAALLALPRAQTHVLVRPVLVVVLLLLALRTMTRVPDWKSTDTIMAALVHDRPDSFRGRWHMARMARAHDNAQRALLEYDRALRLWPYREGLVQEAAAFAAAQKQDAWAHQLAAFGAERWPHNANFHRMLAGYALDAGDTVTARRVLDRALQLHPADTLLNAMRRSLTPDTQ